jgi:hypothetical protein
MRKIYFLFAIFFSIQNFANCQKLVGLFKLTDYNDMKSSYLKFFNNNFIYFNMVNGNGCLDCINEINEIGSGEFEFKNDSLVLNFNTDSIFIDILKLDSIVTIFKSNNKFDYTLLNFEIDDNTNKFVGGNIKVVTKKRNFYSEIKKNKAEVKIPRGEVILLIEVGFVGLPKTKPLMYDLNYNVIDYKYFINDLKAPINIHPDEVLKFPIVRNYGDSNFLFRKKGPNGLKKVSTNGLLEMKSFLYEKEPRLKKILEWDFKGFSKTTESN